MSKNSKNAQRIKEAKTRNRPKGFKGPAKTKCLHTKANAWYRKGDNNNRKQSRQKEAEQ